MKCCPRCHRPAPTSAEVCLSDGVMLSFVGGWLAVRNPSEPPPGIAETTVVGPPPLPPKSSLESGSSSASEGDRQHTVMYARADISGSLPAAAPRAKQASDTAGRPARPTMRQAAADAELPPATLEPERATVKAKAAAESDLSDRATLMHGPEGDLDPDVEEERSAYVGKLIDERYLVKALVGRGGMGAVYRVEQIHLRKDMAIKLLHENLIARKQLVSRFTREARAISRLSSPHTVMVYDFGRWGEVFFLVMELLEGIPLDELLTQVGPMPADRTTAIVLQMCDSLQEAHEHGIVHRDLKPENVMILSDAAHKDFVKILDFGLAKVEDVDDPYTIHSQKDIFGTPFYMSPEQIRAAEVDGRSDLYAIGALLFRMLTGKQVFGSERSTFDILKAHLMEAPPRLNDVVEGVVIPEALETIVAKALEKDPDKRYQSMKELSEALVEARKTDFSGKAPPRRKPIPPSSVGADVLDAPKPYAETAAASEVRLVEDDEAFGRHVRRGRLTRRLLFTGATLACVLGLAALVMSPVGGASGDDREPNDTPSQAKPLDADNSARGTIGERRSALAGDRDCFRLPAGVDDDLSVDVSAVPNMDLELRIHDTEGRELTVIDHRGSGEGESGHHIDTKRAPAVVCVGEKQVDGGTANESLSDVYQLRVHRRIRGGPIEREPNDVPGKEALPGGLSLIGSLDGPRDIDVFRIDERLDDKVLRVSVESADRKPLTGMRLALLDARGKLLATEVLRPNQVEGEVAFASSDRQQPDRVSLRWIGEGAARWAPDDPRSGAYKIWFRVEGLQDQQEREPNNTAASASPMVVGAWHVGDAMDAAGVDWVRVDGGDVDLRRIRIEAGTPPGCGFVLTVHDPVGQVDVRQITVTEATNDQEIVVDGRGAGFLLRVERLPPQGRKRTVPDSRYRLRVRWAQPGSELPRLEIP